MEMQWEVGEGRIRVGVGWAHLWTQIPGSSGWRQGWEEIWEMVQMQIQRRGKPVPASASLSCARGRGR